MDDATREHVRAELALPAVNTLLRVTVGVPEDPEEAPLAADAPSRVEDVVPASGRRGSTTTLLIAQPHFPGEIEILPRGLPCLLAWFTQRGMLEMPVALLGTEQVGPRVRAWRVEVTGPTVRIQRRQFFRLAIELPVRVRSDVFAMAARPGLAEDLARLGLARTDTLQGVTVDIGEGGVRCLLPQPRIPDDTPIVVTLDVAGQERSIASTLLRCRVSDGRGPLVWDCAVQFRDVGEHGDDLRSFLFAEQLRIRRGGA